MEVCQGIDYDTIVSFSVFAPYCPFKIVVLLGKEIIWGKLQRRKSMSVLDINFKAVMSNEFKKETKRWKVSEETSKYKKQNKTKKNQITFWN